LKEVSVEKLIDSIFPIYSKRGSEEFAIEKTNGFLRKCDVDFKGDPAKQMVKISKLEK
jgi:hypothetical protein